MSQTITITNEDILEQVKLSLKIPEIIDEIITRKVITNRVTEEDIKVEDKELQETADKIRLVNKVFSVEDTWIWLKKYGLSLEDFEAIIYEKILNAKFVNHLFMDKIEPYFYENQLEYAGVVMYEIVLDDEDLAMELFYSIKEGEMSFYDTAHKYIQDQELKRKCGYRGILYRKDLKPDISAAVFAAKAPQLLKPIVTSKGVHLILVEEIIQPEFSQKIRSQILSDFFDSWVKEMKDDFNYIFESN